MVTSLILESALISAAKIGAAQDKKITPKNIPAIFLAIFPPLAKYHVPI
jgi:hypothetical protein